MATSIADTARKASAGQWRKPRMKVYDYNQELGGNYYQPMIEYIHTKNLQGPFFEKKPVHMPVSAEVVSNKYSNMRYNDKTPMNVDIDNFLVQSYAKQIKELNSSTAMARVTMTRAAVSNRPSAHSPLDNVTTPYNPIRLLKGAPPGQERVNFYTSELQIAKNNHVSQEKKNRDHIFGVQTFGEYDYHHNFYHGAANRDTKFYDPEKVRGYVKGL